MPRLRSVAIDAAANMVRELYAHPDGAVGGDLHIVLDDWNLDDGDIESCAARISSRSESSDKGFVSLEQRLVSLLQSMTENERASVLALSMAYFE